jgi:cellulase (glycosyl hydrolase family 5)
MLLLVILTVAVTAEATEPGRWAEEKANQWYASQTWLVGSNFLPSTAINELEMWQADTFDPKTIDRELGWAESIGMNSMRVFLHNLPWSQDSEGFLDRLEKFLQIADKHHIRITFVLLDSVWDPYPEAGKQRVPRPHVHNSGWVQAPGAEILKDSSRWDKELKPYITGVLKHFRDDSRIVMWDLMNEPDNDNRPYRAKELPNKAERATELLKREWQWAREVNPSQPLTSGVWKGDWSSDRALSDTARFQLENSDVITFHSYEPPEVMKRRIDSLRRFQRPLISTEYMARPLGSTFQTILPLLKDEHVGAYNWGFVSGKSQTIYPWDSWEKQYTGPPPVWFHDIFHPDGKPYDAAEVELIKRLTGKGKAVSSGKGTRARIPLK